MAMPGGLADPRDVGVLQVTDAAVDHLVGVRGRGAGEVAALDQRHREAALRRVEGGRRAEDAPADNDQVEAVARERGEIALHGRDPALGRWWPARSQAGARQTAASFLVRTFTSLP
jgi:hypothetical protein